MISASFDDAGTWQNLASFSTISSSVIVTPEMGFITPSEGFAVTFGGVLLLTFDGGHTWTTVDFSVGWPLSQAPG